MDFLFERRDRHYAHRYPHAYIIPGMIRNTPGHLNTGVILWEEAPRQRQRAHLELFRAWSLPQECGCRERKLICVFKHSLYPKSCSLMSISRTLWRAQVSGFLKCVLWHTIIKRQGLPLQNILEFCLQFAKLTCPQCQGLPVGCDSAPCPCPRGCVTMSGDTFHGHNWRGGGPGIQWVKTRDAVNHPVVPRMVTVSPCPTPKPQDTESSGVKSQ